MKKLIPVLLFLAALTTLVIAQPAPGTAPTDNRPAAPAAEEKPAAPKPSDTLRVVFTDNDSIPGYDGVAIAKIVGTNRSVRIPRMFVGYNPIDADTRSKAYFVQVNASGEGVDVDPFFLSDFWKIAQSATVTLLGWDEEMMVEFYAVNAGGDPVGSPFMSMALRNKPSPAQKAEAMVKAGEAALTTASAELDAASAEQADAAKKAKAAGDALATAKAGIASADEAKKSADEAKTKADAEVASKEAALTKADGEVTRLKALAGPNTVGTADEIAAAEKVAAAAKVALEEAKAKAAAAADAQAAAGKKVADLNAKTDLAKLQAEVAPLEEAVKNANTRVATATKAKTAAEAQLAAAREHAARFAK